MKQFHDVFILKRCHKKELTKQYYSDTPNKRLTKNMRLYHAMTGADAQCLNLFPNHSKNILLAASMLCFEKRWQKNLPIIQQKAKSIFADSGLIGWLKSDRYCSTAFTDYALHPERVLQIQSQIDPDLYSHVDIPCEPLILAKGGISKDLALNQTIANAKFLRDASLSSPSRIKVFAVQGYSLEDYKWSINQLQELGFFELDPSVTWFAIGSVCMRTPLTGLYEVAKLVRALVPSRYHLHCFGIANPVWVLELAKIGIDSCDSATAGAAAGMGFSFIDEGGKRRKLLMRSRNKYMYYAMQAFNIASLEFQIEQGIEPAQPDLLDLLEWNGHSVSHSHKYNI